MHSENRKWKKNGLNSKLFRLLRALLYPFIEGVHLNIKSYAHIHVYTNPPVHIHVSTYKLCIHDRTNVIQMFSVRSS